MAYDPTVPPSLIGQGIGGTEGLRFFSLVWIDPIAAVLAPGYITNANDLGMRVGDSVVYKDTANVGEWMENHLIVTDIDEMGNATLAFPPIPLEAMPESDMFDPDDETQFLVIYQNGQQYRIQIGMFSPNPPAIASQAEAEAGLDNDKRMTALRTAQAITAQFLNNLTVRLTALVTKTTPVNADGFVVVDSADSNTPKRVTFLNLAAAVFGRIGGLIATATEKTTPVDADTLLISDSANAGAGRRLSIANLKAILAGWVSSVSGFTSKVTPDDADVFGYVQTSDSTGRKFTWANLKSAILAIIPLTREYVSAEQTITAGGVLTLAHGLGVRPKIFSFSLVCRTAEHNYLVGDEVLAISPNASTAGGGNMVHSVTADATNVVWRFSTNVNGFAVADKGTRAPALITNASWRLVIRAIA